MIPIYKTKQKKNKKTQVEGILKIDSEKPTKFKNNTYKKECIKNKTILKKKLKRRSN